MCGNYKLAVEHVSLPTEKFVIKIGVKPQSKNSERGKCDDLSPSNFGSSNETAPVEVIASEKV
jgi:hypothetical protein